MLTCMSWRRSAGSTNRVRAPGAVGAGHRDRLDVALVGDERLRYVEPVDALVGLADPVEARRSVAACCAASSRCPAAGTRSRPAPASCVVAADVSVSRPRRRTARPRRRVESPAGRCRRPARPRRCTARTSRRTRTAAARSPTAGCAPRTAGAGDDVAHRAAREHGVRLGEDRAVGGQLGLRRQPARRGVVARIVVLLSQQSSARDASVDCVRRAARSAVPRRTSGRPA